MHPAGSSLPYRGIGYILVRAEFGRLANVSYRLAYHDGPIDMPAEPSMDVTQHLHHSLPLLGCIGIKQRIGIRDGQLSTIHGGKHPFQ